MPHPASFLWLDVTARRGMKKSQCQQQDSRGPHNCEQATGVLTWSSSFRPSLRFGAVSVSLSLSMGSGLLTTMIRLRMMRCCCCTSSPGYLGGSVLCGRTTARFGCGTFCTRFTGAANSLILICLSTTTTVFGFAWHWSSFAFFIDRLLHRFWSFSSSTTRVTNSRMISRIDIVTSQVVCRPRGCAGLYMQEGN